MGVNWGVIIILIKRMFTWDPKWISTLHNRNSVKISFYWGQNKIKFCFGSGPRKAAHLVKASHFRFYEINACADVPFHAVSVRVVFTWYFITLNEIFCQNNRIRIIPNKTSNEFHFGFYLVSSYKKFARYWNENISVGLKWNLMETPSS